MSKMRLLRFSIWAWNDLPVLTPVTKYTLIRFGLVEILNNSILQVTEKGMLYGLRT